MIFVSNEIRLKAIQPDDYQKVFELMNEIYPAAYEQFWEDKGDWYLKSQYNKNTVLEELNQKDSFYSFIYFKDSLVGIMRVLWKTSLMDTNNHNEVKLHRLYLKPSLQGKGIGKQLLQWLEKECLKSGASLLWLDVMDKKSQAVAFYKNIGFKHHSSCKLPFKLMFREYTDMSQLFKKI